MRRFVVVASLIASGIACVDLNKPPQVADCATKGTCVNGTPDAPTTPNLDGDTRPLDATSTVFDAIIPGRDSQGPSVVDGDLEDIPVAPSDGPEGPRDAVAPDVPLGICSAGGVPRPAGTPCRTAVDLCDVTEVCDGISLDCPADKLAPAATPCRPASGDCDIAETCDGTGAGCPVDGFKAAGTLCRPVAGLCDVAESCDGLAGACPTDSVAPSSTPCRTSTDNERCDPTENCTGTGVQCPGDLKYAKPSAPTAVTATAGALQVTVAWTASTGATGYNVKQSLTAGSGYTTLVSSPTTTKSPFMDTSLAGGTSYHYVVSAINTIPSCESANSSEATATTTGTCVAPAAPVITATPANGSVALSWAAVTNAVSYTVARSQTSGTGYATIGTVKTGTTFVDGNVVNGVTYYYVVTASNGTCSSVNSNEVSTAPACTPPAAPTGVTVTAGNGSATLKWTASVGAVSYSISRNTTGAEPFTFVNSTTQLTFTDSNVVNNTKYYYVVRASNGSCASGNSVAAPVTPACIPPSAPAGITVTPGDTQNALSWTAPAGATQYRVSRNTAGTGAFAQVGTPATTNYTDKSLTNGTIYYYVVAASNGSCWSADSAVASGTPVCTPPAAPGTLTATPGTGQISLSWTASPNAAEYAVWRKDGAAGAYAQIATSKTTIYIDSTVISGVYFYKITAGNGSCSSAYSAEQSASPVPVCAQTPPANVKAAPSGSVQVTITWDPAATQPNTYSIQRSTTNGTGYVAIGEAAGTAVTYTDTDTALVKDTTYYYQVVAVGSCTATSVGTSATPTCATLATPAPANTSGKFPITWSPVAGATSYTVYRSTTSGGTYTSVGADQTLATFTDTGTLNNGDAYYYKVSASGANGQCASVQSSAVTATTCTPLSAPGGLSRTVGTSGAVVLSWSSVPDAGAYSILRGNASGGPFTQVSTVNAPTTTFTNSGLTNDTSYYFVVQSVVGNAGTCASADSTALLGIPRACQVLMDSTSNFTVTTTAASCFVTCNDFKWGWGCDNFTTERSVTVNGQAVNCGGTLPAQSNSAFTFRLGATGTNHTWDAVHWSGNAHTCP